MNQIKKKIKYIAVTIIFALIVNISYISFAQASVSSGSLISLTNSARSQAGLGALSSNSQLTSAAVSKANDMFANQYFSHNSPQGKTPWDFISGAGYGYVYAGENLAIGYADNSDLFNAWMNSATHRDNILNPNYREIGIAAVSGTYEGAETIIVVQEFGSQSSAAPQNTAVASASNSKQKVTQTSQNQTKGQDLGYTVDLNKTNFTPNKIFASEEVAFVATITGKISEVHFEVGEQKISLSESLSKEQGDVKNLSTSAKIQNPGDFNVVLVVTDQWGNVHNQDIGKLQVLPTVISKNQTTPVSQAGLNLMNVIRQNPILFGVGLAMLIGGAALIILRRYKLHLLS